MTATTTTEKLTTAIANGYRALQAQFKALRDENLITLQVKLNSSFEVLRDEAERLIESYRPIADTEAAIAADAQKIEKIVASLPASVITNNSDFSARILIASDKEKKWLILKDRNGEGVTLYKPEGSVFYASYAGDALRIITLFNTPTIIADGGVLMTEIGELDLEGILQRAKKMGLKMHFSDRLLSQPIADTQPATVTDAQKIRNVSASLPSGVISNNSEFSDSILKGTNLEKQWLRKKNGNSTGFTLYKPEGSGFYVSYAGDALKLIALLDTALVICNGVLMTEIRESDLYGIVEKAEKQGLKLHFN